MPTRRITHVPPEVDLASTGPRRVTHLPVEVDLASTGPRRLTHQLLEIDGPAGGVTPPRNRRLTQLLAEYDLASRTARTTHVLLEADLSLPQARRITQLTAELDVRAPPTNTARVLLLDPTWQGAGLASTLHATVDIPTVSWLYITDQAPVKRQITRPLRGVLVPCGWYWTFHAQYAYRQQQFPPTDAPSFLPVAWPPGASRWVTFNWGDPPGSSPSNAPIFYLTRPALTGYLPVWTGNLVVPPASLGGSFLLQDDFAGGVLLNIIFPGLLVSSTPFVDWDPFTQPINGWYARVSSSASPGDPRQVWFETNELVTDWLPAPIAPLTHLDKYQPVIENIGNALYPLGWQAWPGPQTMADYAGEDGYHFWVFRCRGQTLTITEIGAIA